MELHLGPSTLVARPWQVGERRGRLAPRGHKAAVAFAVVEHVVERHKLPLTWRERRDNQRGISGINTNIIFPCITVSGYRPPDVWVSNSLVCS